MSSIKTIIITKTVLDEVTGKNKRVPTGTELEVTVYTAAEIAEVEGGSAWVEAAIESAILANARNAGEQDKLPKTILELITPAERAGGAEALKLHREFINSLVAYLKSTGRKAGVIAIWSAMAGSAAAIQTATQAARDGLVAQLEAYAASLSAEDATKFEANILKLSGNLTGSTEVNESDFE